MNQRPMNVRELRAALDGVPDDFAVCVEIDFPEGHQLSLPHWIFDGQEVRKVGFVDWVVWVETEMAEGASIVGRTDVAAGVDVRTDFLASPPLTFGMEEHPLHFETMVFGGPMDGEIDRYETVEQARAGHELMVARVRNMISRKEGAR